MRSSRALEVAAEGEHVRVPGGFGLHLFVNLIPVGEPIQKLCLDRLLPEERPFLHPHTDLPLRKLPRRCDSPDHLTAQRGDDLFGRFAMRPGERALGQLVHRVLVFVTMVQPGFDTKLLERPLQERLLCDEPGEAKIARRLQVDLFERGRKIVGPVSRTDLPEGFRISHRKLPALPKCHHRVSDLLNLCPAHRGLAHPGDQPDHFRVVRGAFERLHDLPDDEHLALRKPGQRVISDRFNDASLEIDLQDRRVRHRGRRPEQNGDRRHQDGEHNGCADIGEDVDRDFFHGVLQDVW